MTSKKKTKSDLSITVVIILILTFVLGFLISKYNQEPTYILQKSVEEKTVLLSNNPTLIVKSIDIPAISSEEIGITGTLTVSVKKGTGSVFVDVSNILVKESAEHSMRLAAEIAYNLSNRSMKDYDTLYRIDITSPAIEGSSAGAAITALTYAAINNLELREDTMLTGTIHEDRTIGPASGILEKAQAAKQINKKVFLVPPYQAQEANLTEKEVCKTYGKSEFCNNEVRANQINISTSAEIKVIEVKTIEDVLRLIIKN